jgi:hypothetical protein
MKNGQKVTNTNGRKGTVVGTDAKGGVKVHTADNGQTRWYTAAQAKRFLRGS